MTQTKFFDLHTTGCGYLSMERTRWVTPKKGPKYLCTSIAFLRGEYTESSKPEITRVDLRIVGGEAFELVEQLMNNLWQGTLRKDSKIFVSAKIGDLYPEAYMKDGEARVMLKGRLLLFKSIHIDKVPFFKASDDDSKKA